MAFGAARRSAQRKVEVEAREVLRYNLIEFLLADAQAQPPQPLPPLGELAAELPPPPPPPILPLPLGESRAARRARIEATNAELLGNLDEYRAANPDWFEEGFQARQQQLELNKVKKE